MNTLSFSLLLTAGAVAADPLPPEWVPYGDSLPRLASYADPTPPAASGGNPMAGPGTLPPTTADNLRHSLSDVCCPAPVRKLFESDREFEGFVGPISNPVLAKDPRSNTYLRFLFINNSFPGGHPFGGGTAQIYGIQANLALTERLSFIVDKDGIAHLNPRNGPDSTGWLNLAAGFKYAFYRNVETQTIASLGLMYEIPSGEADVFQNHGSGSLIPFVTFGKEFGGKWHYLQTSGYYVPLRANAGSSFFFNSFHIDRQIGWFYPLAELNWFWYTSGGNRLPNAVGEGDGLLNLGTQGMANRQLVTAAIGGKAIISRYVTVGAAYEFPLTSRHDILNERITVEMIVRY
jgi:hypothetical protein